MVALTPEPDTRKAPADREGPVQRRWSKGSGDAPKEHASRGRAVRRDGRRPSGTPGAPSGRRLSAARSTDLLGARTGGHTGIRGRVARSRAAQTPLNSSLGGSRLPHHRLATPVDDLRGADPTADIDHSRAARRDGRAAHQGVWGRPPENTTGRSRERARGIVPSSKWRWRESNPRPSVPSQGFSGCSTCCRSTRPQRLHEHIADRPSHVNVPPRPRGLIWAVSHLADAGIWADDEPRPTETLSLRQRERTQCA